MSAVTDAAGYLEPSQSKGGARGTNDVTPFKPITYGGYPEKGSDDYLMQSPSRGWAYILNLAGSAAKKDVEKLQTTLKTTLQFTVLPIERDMVKDIKNTKNIVSMISEKVKEDEDCVFIAVLYVEKDVNSMDLEKIWKVLVENNKCSKMMATKPKIFLFQEYQPTVSTDHFDKKSSNETFTIPTHSDVLLMFGFGPKYISTLCSVLEEGSMNDDVLSLLTMVNERLGNNGACKLPFFTSMLNYDLKFPPKNHQSETHEEAMIEKRLQDITPTTIPLEQQYEKLIKDIEAHIFTLTSDDDQEGFKFLLKRISKKAKLNGITAASIKKGREMFKIYQNFESDDEFA